jgi:hypothetical protein
MNQQYAEYLESDHWKQLRAAAIEKWGDRCSNCSVPRVDVHHLRYGTLFDVTTDDLMPLCRRCHDNVHASPRLKCLLAGNHPSSVKRQTVLGFLAGRDEAITMPVKRQTRAEVAREVSLLQKKRRVQARASTRERPEDTYVKPNTTGGVVVLSRRLIEQCRTCRGGFSGATIRAFGLQFPLKAKWARRLEGRVITAEAYQRARAGSGRP